MSCADRTLAHLFIVGGARFRHSKHWSLSGKGSIVNEYRGEVISQNLFLECTEGIYKNNKNFYFLEFEKGEVIDACQKGINAHFCMCH